MDLIVKIVTVLKLMYCYLLQLVLRGVIGCTRFILTAAQQRYFRYSIRADICEYNLYNSFAEGQSFKEEEP